MRIFLSVLMIFAFLSCSTFVVEKEQSRIKKLENSTYILNKAFEASGVKLLKNAKVKIIIIIGSEWVKVYAHDSKTDPLIAKRVLISDLYFFENDFKDEIFNYEVFKKKFDKILKKIK